MFISLEGLDGSGKSTQVTLLLERLADAGFSPVALREPGGSRVSERIRAMLLDDDLEIDPFAEMLLFSAARAQLVREVIRPALADGRIVVCDRFLDSTVAYQGAGRGVADADWLEEFQRHVTGGLLPDRTYLVRLEPGDAARRLERRRGSDPRDRMEQAGFAFFAAVADAYDRLADANPERFVVVDGLREIEAIAEAIWEDLEPRLRGPGSHGTGA